MSDTFVGEELASQPETDGTLWLRYEVMRSR